MIMMKKIAVVTAMLGLGVFTACSDGDDVASSFSETNTGKPVEKVGTLADIGASEAQKLIEKNDLKNCGSRDEVAGLAKVSFDADTNVTLTSTVACVSVYELVMDTRVQVVDVKGRPVAGATVYKKNCSFDNEYCRYVTDEEGYFYMNDESYITLYPGSVLDVGFNSIQFRVLSADTSLGTNVISDFAGADVVKVDGKQYAELKQIVLEPVYTAKLYLDSLFVKIDESANEEDKTDIEEFNQNLTEMIDEKDDDFEICLSYYGEHDVGVPSNLYPCQKATEEDYKNGYVVLFGLPEGTYQVTVNRWWSFKKYLPQVVVKP